MFSREKRMLVIPEALRVLDSKVHVNTEWLLDDSLFMRVSLTRRFSAPRKINAMASSSAANLTNYLWHPYS